MASLVVGDSILVDVGACAKTFVLFCFEADGQSENVSKQVAKLYIKGFRNILMSKSYYKLKLYHINIQYVFIKISKLQTAPKNIIIVK